MDEPVVELDHPRFRFVWASIFTRRLAPDCMTHRCTMVATQREQLDACCQSGCDVDLDEHDRVIFAPGPRTQSWTMSHGDQVYEFGRPARFASNNVGACYEAAAAGAGIALLTDFMVARDCERGILTYVLPEWTGRAIEVNAVYPARQNLPPRLSLFLDHLAKALSPPPWAIPAPTA